MRYWIKTTGMSVLALSVLAGCGSTPRHEPLPNDPFYAPIIPQIPSQKVTDDGSLFQASLSNGLYSDAKARRVGDIITVILRENTSATKSANTVLDKESSYQLDPVIGLGGANVNLGGDSIQLDLNSTSEFEGDSQTSQNNNLNGNISVTVVQVLPNNNLVIRGEKWLTLNTGDEYIRLTGIVRPADVNPANEVISTKIANARISYSGTGSFAKVQKQGWLSQFFTASWWPF